MREKNLWDSLLEPINPHLCVLLGYLDIAFGILGLMPGADSAPVYSFLDSIAPSWTWSLSAVALGVLLVVMQKVSEVSSLVIPMWFNGMYWAFLSGTVLFIEWNSSGWLLMAFIAIYSIFVAANFKVNFGKTGVNEQ